MIAAITPTKTAGTRPMLRAGTGARLCAAVLLSLVVAGCGGSSSNSDPNEVTVPTPTPSSSVSPIPTITVTPSLVAEGARIFFQETFQGNGRTCGTCHPARGNFTLSLAFIASLPGDDPLFVAERVPDLADLENPDLMHGPRALILENVDGFDQPPVFRGVPHVFDLAATAPFGWSGSIETLEEFANAAVRQHFTRTLRREEGIDFRLPTDDERAALAAFMESVLLPGIDPFGPTLGLTPAAARGRDVFFGGNAKCDICHNGLLFTDNAFFDTGVTQRSINRVPPPECSPPCGPIGNRELGGQRAFNNPTLLGLANTAPYFHDNSAATIRDAVAHYTTPEFNASEGGAFVGGISLTDSEIDDITAFLAALTTCGNGVVDVGEECDDGNQQVDDGCRPNCTRERCGDGIVDPSERCDPGTGVTPEDCRSRCPG